MFFENYEAFHLVILGLKLHFKISLIEGIILVQSASLDSQLLVVNFPGTSFLSVHFSHRFQSFENKWLNDVPFFISAFALFCLSLFSLGIGKFEKSVRRLENCLDNLDWCSGQCPKVNAAFHPSEVDQMSMSQCPKVNAAFHPSEVDQMSMRNSWGLSGKNNV